MYEFTIGLIAGSIVGGVLFFLFKSKMGVRGIPKPPKPKTGGFVVPTKAVPKIPCQNLPKNAEKALEIAKKYEWNYLDYQPKNRMISFINSKKDRINYFYTTRTVGTCITHPTSGKTQLFRKRVTDAQLEKIFENPRIHTGKGYHKKHKLINKKIL